MLDYRGIEALYAVQELQSFELAAKKLHITQSAVSQRIKALEIAYGEPVLVRTLPYRPTKLGQQLIGHFKRIVLLEEDVQKQLEAPPRISIAINRDSLETWFMDLIQEMELFGTFLFEIIADDQERTLQYLKNGLVSCCLSTSEQEIQGGAVHFLGHMEYVLVASPHFVQKHFSKEQPFRDAPALKFDKNDKLHERYLEKYFGLSSDEIPFQIIPSVRGFKQCALLGYGYGLIPKIDIVDELKTKKLIQLYPDKTWNIPLYWHTWAVQSKSYKKFNKELIRLATQILIVQSF